MHNILICDDDKDIIAALKIYLAAEGYRLFEAHSGYEAIEIVESEEIHLILMDIMMPGLDGIAATAKLREHHNIPIILLTAKSEDADKVLGLGIGADDYITKPFSPHRGDRPRQKPAATLHPAWRYAPIGEQMGDRRHRA